MKPLAKNLIAAFAIATLFTLLSQSGFMLKVGDTRFFELMVKLRDHLGYAPNINNNLKILTVDDQFISYTKQVDISSEDWLRFLDTITDRKPKMVLIDKIFGVFPDANQSLLAKIRNKNIPIYTAAFTAQKPIKYRAEVNKDSSTLFKTNHLYQEGKLNYAYGSAKEVSNLFRFPSHIEYFNTISIEPLLPVMQDRGLIHLGLAPFEPKYESGILELKNSVFPQNNAGDIYINYMSSSDWSVKRKSALGIFARAVRNIPIKSINQEDIVLILPLFYTGHTDFVASPFGEIEGGRIIASVLNAALNEDWIVDVLPGYLFVYIFFVFFVLSNFKKITFQVAFTGTALVVSFGLIIYIFCFKTMFFSPSSVLYGLSFPLVFSILKRLKLTSVMAATIEILKSERDSTIRLMRRKLNHALTVSQNANNENYLEDAIEVVCKAILKEITLSNPKTYLVLSVNEEFRELLKNDELATQTFSIEDADIDTSWEQVFELKVVFEDLQMAMLKIFASKSLDDSDKIFVRNLIQTLGSSINRFLMLKIREEQTLISSSLEVAKTIQEEFIPPPMENQKVKIIPIYHTCEQLGGDWIGWSVSPDQSTLLFVMADVTGHGIKASLMTGVLHGAYRKSLGLIEKNNWKNQAEDQENNSLISQVMNSLNEVMYFARNSGSSTATSVGIQVDLTSGNAILVSAGHPPPILITKDKVKKIKNRGNVLGFDVAQECCTEYHFQINAGEVILFYTDGLFENQNQNGQHLKLHNLRKELPPAYGSAESALEITTKHYFDIMGEFSPEDDCAIVAIQYK